MHLIWLAEQNYKINCTCTSVHYIYAYHNKVLVHLCLFFVAEPPVTLTPPPTLSPPRAPTATTITVVLPPPSQIQTGVLL